MKKITLYDYQLDAVKKMKKGCILCGDVGSGKSLTALAYYYLHEGGKLESLSGNGYFPMREPPADLYIITTARKRDTKEWEGELSVFSLSSDSKKNAYCNRVIVDSWNNIRKYTEVTNAFFIFDEQRVVGSGAWVKAFLKITKSNTWILLSATPGDTWQDYIPVFLANGFYPNRTAFTREHIVYNRYSKFPKVDRYLNTKKLNALRNSILVQMDFQRETNTHHETIETAYDISKYKEIGKNRWNPWTNAPIANAAELCYVWRRIVNTDPSRETVLLDILTNHPKAIVFYNFDYELDILNHLLSEHCIPFAQWNGHKHEPIPDGNQWVYLVQYNAGAEGWNCVQTDTMIFYSQNYSYKMMQQAEGRINRLNTPYQDLYYYHLRSRSSIDIAIQKALQEKRSFHESAFVKW